MNLPRHHAMPFNTEHPIKIVIDGTFKTIITSENWPGKTPVEVCYADHLSDYHLHLPGNDVLIALDFTQEMGAASDSLKLIQRFGAGMDKVDFAAIPKGCSVCNCYEHEKPIAEWVVMAMIAMDREIIKVDQTLRVGSTEMAPTEHALYPELEGRTLGIIGLGRIGRKTAELIKPFDMRVISVTRTIPDAEDIRNLGLDAVEGMDRLDWLLEESDFVLLSLPLTKDSSGLIGQRELSLMKSDASLINVSRAELTQEKPLFEALKNQQIKSAALDVWYYETWFRGGGKMLANLPFAELDNVLMSPHAAVATTGVLRRRLNFISANVDRLANGEPLLNVVHVG